MKRLSVAMRLLALAAAVFANWVSMQPNSVRAQSNQPDRPITAQEMERYFDQVLAQQMIAEHIPGATVSVVKDGAMLFAKGYGFADLDKQIPVVADRTLFFPGSAGKLFTWTALMQLVEEGKLNLKADINTYLDFEIPAAFPEPVTLENLLTHTAGFEEQLAALQVTDKTDVLPLREFLMRALPARVYAPGTIFAYSNYGTALAGYIVERVAGQPFEQYISQHILSPLEMVNSSATQPLPESLQANLSKGYHFRQGQYQSVDFEWIAAPPAAPIRTTATDMAKFMLAHLACALPGQDKLLQVEWCNAMHQKQFAHDPRLNGMGYGFMVSAQNNQTIAWHTGGSAHFNTMLALIPEQNLGFFVSYNAPVADLYQPLVSFVDHFYPAPAPKAMQPPADTATRIAALSGSYVSSRVAHQSAQKLATWQAEGLEARPGPNNTVQVGSRFYAEVEPGFFRQVNGPRLLTYRADARGEVTHLFFGQFAYFKVPGFQTTGVQLIAAAAALLIMLTAALAWFVDWVVQRRRGNTNSYHTSRTARVARWVAAGLGIFNAVLIVWLMVSLLGIAQTFVFPTTLVTTLTWLFWINVPTLIVLLLLTMLAWKNQFWRPVWRVHYTLVTLAASMFVAFLINWNLLAGL